MDPDRVPAVLLDRDGVLNVKAPEGDYITSPDALVLLAGVPGAVQRLHDAGCALIVVTNQRGVARGWMTEQDLAAVHRRLAALLPVPLSGLYACVHEAGTCDCRKPAPGMLLRALADHPELDPDRVVMVGDSPSDIEAGRRAGVATVAVGGVGGADYGASDLAAAVPWILARVAGGGNH